MTFVTTVCALILVIVAAPLSAQLVVTPDNLQGWELTTRDQTTLTEPAPASYLGPGFETPPLGSGSLHLAVGSDGADNASARHSGYADTLLSNITALSYSTFVEIDGSGGQAPYLILNVDTNGDTAVDDFLLFEPLYQSAAFFPSNPQGPLVTDTWQTWDALAGGWYSVFGTGGSGPGAAVVPFSTLVAALPANARIVNSSGLGGVRIVTGIGAGAWDNFLGAADNFTIGVSGSSTTYDFETVAALVTVTTATPGGWVFEIDDEAPAGTSATVTIVSGPATPPNGDGSLQLSVGTDGNDAAQARNNDYDFFLLRDLSGLAYSTYIQTPGSSTQAPYIMLDVDYTGDGTRDDILFFEPAYQDGTFCPSFVQPAVTAGTWQTWDAASGCWGSLSGTGGATPGAGVKPLATIVDTQPNARLAVEPTGALRVVAGYGSGTWDNFVGNVDALQVAFTEGLTLYDFEPIPVITIGDVAQAEGTGGTTNFVFTLTLSEAVSQLVTVDYTTANGTATTDDYGEITTPPTVNFSPGTTSRSIVIAVGADTQFEPDETFFVNLSNPRFAVLDTDAQGQGTIQNDDAPVADLSITKTGPSSTPPDANITYTITVTNAGPDAASNAVVTDVLPAGSSFVSATPSQGSCSGTTTVTCTLGAIANGGSATITLVIDPPNAGTFTNTATVTNTPEPDPTPADNAGTALTAVHSAIPTLSEWALLALLLALAAVAAVKLR